MLYILKTLISASHLYEKHEGQQDFMGSLAVDHRLNELSGCLTHNVNTLLVLFSVTGRGCLMH